MDKKIDNEAVVFFDWVNIIANKCNSFLLDFVKELLSVFFTNVFLSYSIKDISLLNFSIPPPLNVFYICTLPLKIYGKKNRTFSSWLGT